MAKLCCTSGGHEDTHTDSRNHKQFRDIWKLAARAIPIEFISTYDKLFSYPHAKNIFTIVKKKIEAIKENQLKDYVLKKLLHLFQAYKSVFIGVRNEEKINFLMLDIMALYVQFHCDQIAFADEFEDLINNLSIALHLTFKGSSLFIIMTLLKVDFEEAYTPIIYPILARQMLNSKLYVKNDIIRYILLILCIRKWKSLETTKRKEEQALMRNKIVQKTLNKHTYHSALKVRTILPHKVPPADEIRRAFTRISDLIGYAISKGDNGTSILLENESMNLKETIDKYFKQYEHLICLESVIPFDKFPQMSMKRYYSNSGSDMNICENHRSVCRTDISGLKPGKECSSTISDVINPCTPTSLHSSKHLCITTVNNCGKSTNPAKIKVKSSPYSASCNFVEANGSRQPSTTKCGITKISKISTMCLESVMLSSSYSTGGILRSFKSDTISNIEKNTINLEINNRNSNLSDASKKPGVISYRVVNISNNSSVIKMNEKYDKTYLSEKTYIYNFDKVHGSFSQYNFENVSPTKVLNIAKFKAREKVAFNSNLILNSIKVLHIQMIPKTISSRFRIHMNNTELLNSWKRDLEFFPYKCPNYSKFAYNKNLRELQDNVDTNINESIIDLSILNSDNTKSDNPNNLRVYTNSICEKNIRPKKEVEQVLFTLKKSSGSFAMEDCKCEEIDTDVSIRCKESEKRNCNLKHLEAKGENKNKVVFHTKTSYDKVARVVYPHSKRKAEAKNNTGLEPKKLKKQECEKSSNQYTWNYMENFVRDSLSKLKLDKLNKEIDTLLSTLANLSVAPTLEAYFITNKIIITFLYECLSSLDYSRITLRKYISICSKAKKLQAKNVDNSHLYEIELKYEELKVKMNQSNIIRHLDLVLKTMKAIKRNIFDDEWLQKNNARIKRYLYADPVEYNIQVESSKKEIQFSSENICWETINLKLPALEKVSHNKSKNRKRTSKRKTSPSGASRPVRNKIDESFSSNDVSFCDFVGEYGSTLGSSILDFMPDEIQLDGPIIPFPQNSGNFNEILEHSLSEADISPLSDNDTRDQLFIDRDNKSSKIDVDSVFGNESRSQVEDKIDTKSHITRKVQACINTKIHVPGEESKSQKLTNKPSHMIENERNLKSNPFWKNILVGPTERHEFSKNGFIKSQKTKI